MRKLLLAIAVFSVAVASSARADMVGAVVGGVVGAVWGKPFWGPSISRGHCWTDNSFHRHCRH
jgi:hypothetical protein